jgi:hypothetical protein
MKPAHLKSVRTIDGGELHVVVDTPEDEEIDFEGCCEAEVRAKLHDFEAWAS